MAAGQQNPGSGIPSPRPLPITRALAAHWPPLPASRTDPASASVPSCQNPGALKHNWVLTSRWLWGGGAARGGRTTGRCGAEAGVRD
jgi:hypothetical protein